MPASQHFEHLSEGDSSGVSGCRLGEVAGDAGDAVRINEEGSRRSVPHICRGLSENALHHLAALQPGEADAAAAADDG